MTSARPEAIRRRLLLALVLAMTPFVALFLVQGREERRHASHQARLESARLVRLLAVDHEQLLADARQLLFVLTNVPAVLRGDDSESARLFRDVLDRYPQYSNLWLARGDGTLIASAHTVDLPIEEEERSLLREAASNSAFVQGPLRIATRRRVPSLALAHGTGRGSALLAVVELQWLNREAATAELPAGSSVTVWDAGGRILLRHPDPDKWVGHRDPDADVLEAILAADGTGTAEAIGVDGIVRLYGFTRLTGRAEGGAVYLAVGVPSEHAFAEARRTERRNLSILAVVAAIALGVAWLAGDRLVVRIVTRLQHLAETDPLTALANRRRLDHVAERELRRSQRFGRPLTLVMVDIDRFKVINDTYGHVVGDAVLRELAQRIRATGREGDLPARFGGEEFAILLLESGEQEGVRAAERIRAAVASPAFTTSSGPVAVTVSAGVAAVPEHPTTLAAWFEAADRALYRAKANGRNRVEAAASDSVEAQGPTAQGA
jgi:diguanylate cyclase (GGDEF)-like protein